MDIGGTVMNGKPENETAVTNDEEFISPKIDYAFKQMTVGYLTIYWNFI